MPRKPEKFEVFEKRWQDLLAAHLESPCVFGAFCLYAPTENILGAINLDASQQPQIYSFLSTFIAAIKPSLNIVLKPRKSVPSFGNLLHRENSFRAYVRT